MRWLRRSLSALKMLWFRILSPLNFDELEVMTKKWQVQSSFYNSPSEKPISLGLPCSLMIGMKDPSWGGRGLVRIFRGTNGIALSAWWTGEGPLWTMQCGHCWGLVQEGEHFAPDGMNPAGANTAPGCPFGFRMHTPFHSFPYFSFYVFFFPPIKNIKKGMMWWLLLLLYML